MIVPQSGSSLFLPMVSKDFALKFLGVFIPSQFSGTWADDMDQFMTLADHAHGVHLISLGFACPWADKVSDIQLHLDYTRSRGAIPFITWMPMNCANGGVGDINAIGMPEILNGTWDAYMTEWADGIAALGYPVFMRWGHEMNIPTYSWGAQHAFGSNGKTDYNQVTEGCGLKGCYGDPNQYDGPERFVAAYRHVHDLVAPRAPNIIWVWNPNGRNWPLASVAPWNDYNNYYPGDAYVDWVGLDGYNWGEQSGNGYSFTWATFDYMFRDTLADLSTRYPTKPQMVPEMGTVEDPYNPNRKAQWIRDAFQSAYSNYPGLHVVIWVQDNTFIDYARNPPAVVDFRINSSPQALQAYKDAIPGWNATAPIP